MLYRLAIATMSLFALSAHADVGIDNVSADVPLVPAVYAETRPVIDGLLDDAIWRTAPRMDDFYVFDLKRPPLDPTYVWIAYDSTHVYFAVRCFDSQPELIAIEETKRGGNISSDDHVSLNLDFSGQHRTEGAWYFKITAGGVQSEVVPGGSASKTEWRGDWIGASHVDSRGWTAEVAIPLSLFNHAGGIATPRVYADRWVPRRQEWAAWPNMGLVYDLAKTGRLTAIVMPRSVRRPTFMPYVVGEYDRRRRSRWDKYAGIDAKYTTPGGLTIVGSINPDNRNIETEVLSLGFSYGERFRADNRPFFVEGGQYTPESRLFYSQRVGDMYGGVKAFGAVGTSQVGMAYTIDRDKVSHLAGRWYARPTPRIAIDHSLAWRHSNDPTTPLACLPATTDNVAGESRFVGEWLSDRVTHTVELRGAGTWTADTVGRGYNTYARYGRNGGNGGINSSLTWQWMGKDWLALDGYFDPDLRDLHQLTGSISWSLQTDDPLIRKWSVSTSGGQSIRSNGDTFTRSLGFSASAETPSGVSLSGGPSFSRRDSSNDHSYSATLAWNIHKLYTSGSVSGGTGRTQEITYRNVSASQGLHVFDCIIMNLGGQYYRRIEDSYQFRTTLQYDITPEHAISGRVVRNWKDVRTGDVIQTQKSTNAYVSYRQVVRNGVDLFLILGDPRATGNGDSEHTMLKGWLTKRVAIKAMIVL
jgi:hypothetical protein